MTLSAEDKENIEGILEKGSYKCQLWLKAYGLRTKEK